MAIKEISLTTIFVSDNERAKDFYVNKLGLELRSDMPLGMGTEEENLRWLTVAPPGSDTEIVLARGYAGWTPELVGKFGSIAFTTDDIKGTFEELSARGVKFTEEPNFQYYGMWQAQFEDEDGNSFVLTSAEPQGQQ
jgi:catechol 2,3-dioxygenase-like lactoylglutathione lyase family enzyme